MKKILCLVFLFVLGLFTLTACQPGETTKPAEEAIKVLLVEQETYVEGDFDVAGTITYEGIQYEISWASNNECLTVPTEKNDNGNYTITVSRPEGTEPAEITLTATITIGEESASKTFDFMVYPVDIYEIMANFVFEKANKVATSDIELPSETTFEGKSASIAWSVPTEYAEAIAIEEGVAKILAKEETKVQLTATFTFGETTATMNYNVTLKPGTSGPTMVKTPTAGVAYKFALNQETNGTILYFNGEVSGYYLATTEDASEAVDVTVEAVEGGYHLSFVVDGTKKYLEIVQSGTYFNAKIVDTPTRVWTYNAEYSTFVQTFEDTDYYMGTYSTYTTISASKLSYAATSYPCHMYAPSYAEVKAPAAGVAYKFALNQQTNGTVLYFNGEVSGYYLATTEDPNAGVDVTVETVDGGFHLSFVVDGAKKYLEIVQSGTYFNAKIVDTPTKAWTYNEEYNTYVQTFEDTDYYMGTYSTYTTISASKLSYAATSYPCHMYAAAYEEVKAPKAGSTYKFALNQQTNGTVLYFNGEVSGYYLATTENPGEAVDVTVEAVDGGFHLSFVVDGAKKYLEIVQSGTYFNAKIVDTPTRAWTYNAEYNTYVQTFEDTDYYMGTYNTYTTISASKLSYAATSYPCHMYSNGTSSTPEEVKPVEKPELVTGFTTTTYAEIAELVPNENDKSEDKYYVIGYVKSIISWSNSLVLEDAEGNTMDTYQCKSFDGVLSLAELPVEIKVGDVVVIYGYANNYKGTIQIADPWIVQVGTAVQEDSDSYKVAKALLEVELEKSYAANFEVPVTSNGATITWTSDNAAIAIDATTGAATVTRGSEDVTVNITAVVKSGSVEEKVEFTVKVPANYDGQMITLTTTSLTVGEAYGNGTATIDGVTFEWTELGDYGNGIQMRVKNGKNSEITNTTAFASAIVKIEFTYTSSKIPSAEKFADELLSVKFGNEAGQCSEGEVLVGQESITITPTGEYTFVDIRHTDKSGALYWESITIYLAE